MELLFLLTVRGFSICNKGKLYCACVRSVTLYGNDKGSYDGGCEEVRTNRDE